MPDAPFDVIDPRTGEPYPAPVPLWVERGYRREDVIFDDFGLTPTPDEVVAPDGPTAADPSVVTDTAVLADVTADSLAAMAASLGIARLAAWSEDQHRRWPAGTPGGLGGKFMDTGDTPSEKLDGVTGGKGTKDDPYMVSNMQSAAILLYRDQHIKLDRPDEVATLLDTLKAFADDAKAKGDKAPTYDICKASIEGTNFFCAESLGVPRVLMPQLSSKNPVPGSIADGMPRNEKGEVDLTAAFRQYLEESMKIPVVDTAIDASHLRASQSQLEGAKVAGMVSAIEAGKMSNTDPKTDSIFVTSDGYIVDGHHRWAANVAIETDTSKPIMMPVRQIQGDIVSILAIANRFAKEMGLPPAPADEFWTAQA